MAFPKVKQLIFNRTPQIVVGVILVVAVGYFLGKAWRASPEFVSKMKAGFPTATEIVPSPTAQQTLKPEEISAVAPKEAPKEYKEVAQKGEGLTHLARRVLKKYLQDHPQDFNVTPEHKVYIEDYLAKALGYGYLQLGQEVTFSQELIQEAINKGKGLTEVQLHNLTQYVQLISQL
jgi:hypothetical protein